MQHKPWPDRKTKTVPGLALLVSVPGVLPKKKSVSPTYLVMPTFVAFYTWLASSSAALCRQTSTLQQDSTSRPLKQAAVMASCLSAVSGFSFRLCRDHGKIKPTPNYTSAVHKTSSTIQENQAVHERWEAQHLTDHEQACTCPKQPAEVN